MIRCGHNNRRLPDRRKSSIRRFHSQTYRGPAVVQLDRALAVNNHAVRLIPTHAPNSITLLRFFYHGVRFI